MKNQTLLDIEYESLKKDLRGILTGGLLKAQKAYEEEKTLTYWKCGKLICTYLLRNEERAAYGEEVYIKLSNDLNLSERLLYQMSRFYNTYPDFEPSLNLKWSHYRMLSTIKDDTQREILEEEASKNSWSFRTLEFNLKEEKITTPKAVTKKRQTLSFSRGRLYHYKIFKTEYSDTCLIDLGFKVFKESGIETAKSSFIETVKLEDSFNHYFTEAKNKHLYTYVASISETITGDTFIATIDLGFNTWIEQKIKLRGISCSEKGSQNADYAKKTVQKKLSRCPFVVIKTHKAEEDIRLVDLFYLDSDDPYRVLMDGTFLNQELLDQNLVQIIS